MPFHQAGKICIRVAAIAALSTTFSHAAEEPINFHGYVRAGLGGSSDGGVQQCFKVAGASSKYRLGNECENYGEFALDANLSKLTGHTGGGPQFRTVGMVSVASPYNEDLQKWTNGLQQFWVEASNIGLGGAKIWGGRRFYMRQDIHISDFFYWNNSGPGAGIEDVPIGIGKLAYMWRTNTADPNRTIYGHDFRIYGLKTNPNGEMTLGVDLRRSATSNGASAPDGTWLNVMHRQTEIMGNGSNAVALQYGRGAVSNLAGRPNFDANPDDKTVRIVENLVWQMGGSYTGAFDVVWEKQTKFNGVGNQTWISVGARPQYHFNDRYAVALEMGHDRVAPDNAPTRVLNKITLAGLRTADKGFWSRPQYRAFVTHARWNQAAQAAAPSQDALSATGAFGSASRGTTYGIQLEAWW